MSYFERKNWGTVDDNRLAIPNIEEIYGEQRQENSVLYLIALSPLYKQGSQAEKQLLNYLSTSKYQYISCQTSKPNKVPVLNNLFLLSRIDNSIIDCTGSRSCCSRLIHMAAAGISCSHN